MERTAERHKYTKIIEKSMVESYKQLVGHDNHTPTSTPELILNRHAPHGGGTGEPRGGGGSSRCKRGSVRAQELPTDLRVSPPRLASPRPRFTTCW